MAEVAVLGLGRMGAAMARRVAEAGHHVRVWNRSPEVGQRLAAGDASGRTEAAPDAAGAVAGADVVLTMLADGAATRGVLLAADVLEALDSSTIVVDLGTSGGATTAALAAEYTQRHCRFVDAPVSGSVPAVEAGTLLVMASGDAADIEAATPVLGSFAATVLNVGPAGNGQVMKLAVNLVVHDLNAAVSESLSLAERAGIPLEAAYDVLARSVAGAPFVQYKRIAFLDESAPVAMSLDLVAKDLRLVLELADELGSPTGSTSAVLHEVDAARAAGWGGADMAALSRFLRGHRTP
jgi:3-hydroxyisobutyrate dehydrogenase-like beta-hydroxyacid dehydrogenase